MITLTAVERVKFAMWLSQEAETDMGIVKQLELLPSMAALAAHRKKEIEAHLLVARKLRSIEESNLG